MRLFVPDSYSFDGDNTFPWMGLIDPKLIQRVPWLLPLLVRPTKVPVISMGTVVTSDSELSQSQQDMMIATEGVDVSLEAIGIDLESIAGTDIDVDLESSTIPVELRALAVQLLNASKKSKGSTIRSRGTGVTIETTKDVADP